MRTPYGSHCSYYYEDLHRGRENRECRLPMSQHNDWNVKLCKTCPMPRYEQCISCDDLEYSAILSSGIMGFFRRVQVSAWCHESKSNVTEPQLGCGSCHNTNMFEEYLTD